MDIRPAGDAARRHHLWGWQSRSVVFPGAGALAVLLLALTGCADEPEPSGDQTPAPALDEPTEETAEGQPTEPETGQGEEDSQGQNQDDTDGTEQEGAGQEGAGQGSAESGSDGSEVLDVSEFSSEPQESTGFPDMLTEFPDDGDELLLTEVRAGQHEGYDRIVFEHAGDGAPGWFAEYVDEAVEPGSGFPIDVQGDAILYISALGLRPENAGTEHGHLELSGWTERQGTVFEDAVTTFVHHGAVSYYVGLDQQRDFRVSVWEHENGPRLIIDVLN